MYERRCQMKSKLTRWQIADLFCISSLHILKYMLSYKKRKESLLDKTKLSPAVFKITSVLCDRISPLSTVTLTAWVGGGATSEGTGVH